MSQLSARYAAALYQTGCREQLLHDTAQLIFDNKELYDALLNPAIKVSEKEEVLKRLPFSECTENLMRFYALLAQKNRFNLLHDILYEYHLLTLNAENRTVCIMRCANMPDEGAVADIAKALCKKHGRDGVEMQVFIDPSLMGGFILEIAPPAREVKPL